MIFMLLKQSSPSFIIDVLLLHRVLIMIGIENVLVKKWRVIKVEVVVGEAIIPSFKVVDSKVEGGLMVVVEEADLKEGVGVVVGEVMGGVATNNNSF